MARAPIIFAALVAQVAMLGRARADDKPPCFAEAAAVKKMKVRDPSLVYPKDARALRHVEAGRRAFGVQQYERAVEEYTSAGLADAAPLILYNLGQTYRAAKSYEKATRQYELFLERGKPGPEIRALVVCHIHTMKAELEHAASTAPLTEPASEQTEATTAHRNGISSAYEGVQGQRPESPSAGPERSSWTPRRKIAVGIGAAGVISVAAGIVFAVQTQRFKDDAERLCPMTSCADADRANAWSDRAGTRATLANISFGMGAGMLVGAAVLWYVGGPSAQALTSDTVIMPRLTSTFAGVSYDGRF